ncbi:MAG: LuxR C-terminal-related transcriptional regulator [Clostridiales Family XIII bacterium]|jgi:LuxR family maltose regulon positive regulatory protein|nr:LuxR C-terminal-related transcriptional regulator [Clostridiales Family XIII bacterium]
MDAMKTNIFHRALPTFLEDRAYLTRPRVDTLIEEAVKHPYVTVSAGLGCGKTQAVYSFLQTSGVPAMWMQLSPRDNDSARFWDGLARTAGDYNPKIASRMRDVGFPDTDELYAKVLSIPEEELDAERKHIFVFDDFHVIEDPDILRFFKRVIQSPFPNISLIIISRADPTIGMVGLLSKGLLANINEADLRFTEDETAQYFRLLDVDLSAESLANIYNDTEGWPFALSLIGLSLKKDPANERNARTAMKLNIFQMIDEEVFSVVSERLRRFLIGLSLIDKFSTSLVSILADDERIIGEMGKINSMIHYDIYLHTYIIHRLFLDYLRQKQDLLSESEKKLIYSKAAQWCDENDYKMEAVSYYEKAGNYKAIINIVYNFPIQVPYEQAVYVLDIYSRGPAELLENIVPYHLQHARLLLSIGRYEDAVNELQSRIAKYSALPPSDFNNQVLCGAYTALGITNYLMLPLTGDCEFDVPMEKAYRYYELSPYDESGSVTSISIDAWASKVGTTRQGAMEEYIAALSRAVPYAMSVLNGFMYGLDDLAQGELLFYKNDLKNAGKFFMQAAHKAETRGQHDIRNRALFYLLRSAAAQGDFDKVQETLRRLGEQLEMREYLDRFITFDIVSAWYYALIGQTALAAGWMKESFSFTSNCFNSDFSNCVRMRLHYTDKQYHELLSFINSVRGRDAILLENLEIKVMEAVCEYHTKDRAAAIYALREAYDMALSNGLVTPFIEFGKDMRTLTAAAMRDVECDIPREWLEMINRKSATYAKRVSYIVSEYNKANNIDNSVRLSPREMEILYDLYHGLTRSEMAAGHDLSVNTVKLVLNTIYAKLGADNVADVIRNALDLKLL